jgi:hypothetical protein
MAAVASFSVAEILQLKAKMICKAQYVSFNSNRPSISFKLLIKMYLAGAASECTSLITIGNHASTLGTYAALYTMLHWCQYYPSCTCKLAAPLRCEWQRRSNYVRAQIPSITQLCTSESEPVPPSLRAYFSLQIRPRSFSPVPEDFFAEFFCE